MDDILVGHLVSEQFNTCFREHDIMCEKKILKNFLKIATEEWKERE